MPVVGKATAFESELVKPLGGAVVAVEDIREAAARGCGVDDLVGVIEIGFDGVAPGVVQPGAAARGGGEAELGDVAVDSVAACLRAPVLEGGSAAGVAPVGAVVGGARHDGEDVPELEGHGDAVRGVGAEGLVVGGAAVGTDVRHVAEHVVRGAAVFGVVAVQVAGAGLRLVVDRQVPDGLRVDGEPAFRHARGAAVEVVDGSADGDAARPVELAVLVGDFVGGDGLAALVAAVEVAAEPRIGVVGGLGAQRVAFGDVGMVLELEAVAFAVHVAAPVAVVALVVAPVVVVAVLVEVPRMIHLELALAVVGEVPADRLSEREPVARAEVGVGGAAERRAAALALVPDVVDVAGEEVAAPFGGVAGQDAQAVLRIERVVPVRHPEDGHVEERHPCVVDDRGAVLDVVELAGEAPVQVVDVVRAGRHHRAGGEGVVAVGGALRGVRVETVGRGGGHHVARGHEDAGLPVCGEVARLDLDFADGLGGGLVVRHEVLQKLGVRRNGATGCKENGGDFFHGGPRGSWVRSWDGCRRRSREPVPTACRGWRTTRGGGGVRRRT